MNKRTCLLLFSLFYAISVFPQTLTEENARIAAVTTLTTRFPNQGSAFSIISDRVINGDNNSPLFFAFSLKPAGFIIVSASIDLPPVISYSGTANLDNDGRFIRFVKADLLRRIKNISKIPGELLEKRHDQWKKFLTGEKQNTHFRQWPDPGKSPEDGWLETNWTQNEPYNLFCPLDPVSGSRSLAGCPALAMAQIINFHNTTSNVHFSDGDDYYHNYAGRNYWIDNDYAEEDFPSFPQLNDYLTSLKISYQQGIPLQDEDMAALVFACGVAAKQVFASNGSGTFGVDQAYDAYLKFNVPTVELLDESDTSLYTRMAQNVMDTLPVHLAVVDPGWTMGHNVVVDGYNTDHYFHLNFGWGGASNGWYLLPDEIPYGLTVIEGAVVDIIPQSVTGVGNSKLPVVSFYPNPTHGKLMICSPASGIRIELYTLTGKRLLKKWISSNSDQLDISEFNSGIYLMKAISSQTETWLKVVKE